MKQFLLFIQVLVISCGVNAKTLYVDAQNGSDSTNWLGNSDVTPWATIGRAAWGSSDRNNQNPAEAAQPGDVVIVRAGTYTAMQMSGNRINPAWNPANSGTPGNPIVFRADGLVILQSVLGGAGGPVIGALERSYITWDGFYVDEPNIETVPDTGPIVIWDSHFIIVENCEVNGKTAFWTDNHNSIRLEAAHNSIVRNNRFYGNRTNPPSSNAASIMTYYSDDILIEANEIFDSDSGIYIKGVNRGPFIIRSNIVHDVDLHGIQLTQVGYSNVAGGGAQIYQNVFRNNRDGLFINPVDGPFASPSIANVDFVNNTLEGNFYGMFIRGQQETQIQNVLIQNNIVINSGDYGFMAEEIVSLNAFTSRDNLYFNNPRFARFGNTNYSLPEFQSALGMEIGTTIADPMFVDQGADNFLLRAGSPAINAGIDILNLNGNGNTAAINLGADMDAAAGIVIIPPAPPPVPMPPLSVDVD